MHNYTIVHADWHIEDIALEQILSSSDYTLFYFYPKDDTPGCTLEAQEFTQLIDQFSQKSIQIVGVSQDSKHDHCAFIEKYHLRPSYLSDPERVLHQQYHARGFKNMYGKMVEWTIRSSVLLDATGNILHHRKAARAKGHAQQVLTWVEKNLI